MARRDARCPACQGQITVDVSPEGGGAECPHCGAKFRIQVRPRAAEVPDPGPSSAPDGAGAARAGIGTGEGSETYSLVDDPPPPVRPAARTASGVAPTPPRPARRAPEATAEEGSTPWDRLRDQPGRLVAVGAGLALVVVLSVVGAGLLRGRGGGAVQADGGDVGRRDVGRGTGGAAAPAGHFVVVDTPVPNVAVAAEAKAAPLFVAAPPADPKPAAPRRPRADAAAADPTSSAEVKPRWDLPPDPRPRGEAPRYAPDLRIPLETCMVQYALTGPPVLADRDGPFALFLPRWEQSPYKVEGKPVRGKYTVALVETPRPPAPLIDLRTGAKVGEFSWKSPFWLDPRLSPGGTYLVGPDAAPTWLNDPNRGATYAKADPNALFVWKARRDKPTHRLRGRGLVLWAEFVTDDRLALYVIAADKPALQLWDVASGKSVATIPLSVERFKVPNVPTGNPEPLTYLPWPTLGAVSPGGRYVAVGGADGIAMASLADGREVGTLPVTLSSYKDHREYQGMAFSPDGAELLVAFKPDAGKPALRAWSATKGTPLREVSQPVGMSVPAMSGPPMPGPEPDTIFAPGYPVAGDHVHPTPGGPGGPGLTARLYEAATGRLLASHAPVLRWSDSGPVIAVGPLKDAPSAGGKPGADADRVGVYATEAIHALFRDAAGKTEFGLAKRPAVREPDRSSVQVVAPEPPAPWTPPPAAKAPPPPADRTVLPARPAAFGDRHAAVVRFAPKQRDQPSGSLGYDELSWDRYDARSGQRVGRPIPLWPWAANPLGPRLEEQKRAVAALTPDGQRLAVRDPDSAGRVDVWTAAGERILGFYPHGPKARVEWIGWGPEGRLLTVGAGVLTAWEVPAAKAVFEVDGGYAAPVAWAPGRAWLAASTTAGHVDLVDAATGKCLGRCAAGVPGRVTDLVVAPDAARLAALYPDPANLYATERFLADLGMPRPDEVDVKLVLWDLIKTGRAEMASRKVRAFALLHWGGPEHLAFCNEFESVVYDLRYHTPVLAYHFQRGHPWPRLGYPLHRSPDGRLWIGTGDGPTTEGWLATVVPDPAGKTEGVFLAADREFFDATETPIRIEIDLGTPAWGETHGRQVAEALQKRGHRVGPGGWRLRIRHQVADAGSSLSQGAQNIPLPKVDYTWELLDPKGNQAWRGASSGYFPRIGSKYRLTKPPPGQKIQPASAFERIDYYDFGGRDVRRAVVEEILETGAGLTLPESLPRRLLKVGDSYPKFPVALDFDFKKGP